MRGTTCEELPNLAGLLTTTFLPIEGLLVSLENVFSCVYVESGYLDPILEGTLNNVIQEARTVVRTFFCYCRHWKIGGEPWRKRK